MPKIPRKQYNPQLQLIPSINKDTFHDGYPSFSFKYIKLDHDKFTINGREENYFKKVFGRFQDLSKMKKQELVTSHNSTLRCHTIDWGDTTEQCFNIPNEEYLVDKPWQFSISANEHGRIMGFFIGNIFYVVWFDPNHDLYESQRR